MAKRSKYSSLSRSYAPIVEDLGLMILMTYKPVPNAME